MTVSDLPRDLLRSIALRSLHAHGSTARHWLRLSLVCTDWRRFLQGAAQPHSPSLLPVLGSATSLLLSVARHAMLSSLTLQWQGLPCRDNGSIADFLQACRTML